MDEKIFKKIWQTGLFYFLCSFLSEVYKGDLLVYHASNYFKIAAVFILIFSSDFIVFSSKTEKEEIGTIDYIITSFADFFAILFTIFIPKELQNNNTAAKIEPEPKQTYTDPNIHKTPKQQQSIVYPTLDIKENKPPEQPKPQQVIDVKELQQAFQALNSMIGLNSVKTSINDLINVISLKQRQKQEGTFSGSIYPPHFIFAGNPGTGKTSVARQLGRIFKAMGLLSKGHVVECKREDLVAGHIGQTEPKTEQKIKEAFGGILFIDEAYTLSTGGDNDFGKVAINILLPYLENNKGQFVCICAGYPNEMKQFLSVNPGLNSRIQEKITFEDYSAYDLMAIFKSIVKSHSYTIDTVSEQILMNFFTSRKFEANGRDVRNLFEAIEKSLANAAAQNPEIPLNKFTKEVIESGIKSFCKSN